jgi:hypothetical protein
LSRRWCRVAGWLPGLLVGVSIRIHELTIYDAHRLFEPLDPPAGYWRCGALNLIARGLVDCESPFTQSNLMSRLKVLDGKSQA